MKLITFPLVVLLAAGSHGQTVGSDIYNGCFTTKECFASPEGCIDDQDCQFIASWAPTTNGNGLNFEMQAYNNASLVDDVESDAYVAIGFSADDGMGDDTVFLFGFDQDVANEADVLEALFHNVNDVQGSQVVRTSLFVADYTDVQGYNFLGGSDDREAGLIYANFIRSNQITYENPLTGDTVVNDLLEQPFYLMIATGSVAQDEDGETVPQYHGENKVVSDAPIIFFG